MFAGETEAQIIRKILLLLRNESKCVFDSSRDLLRAYSNLVEGKNSELRNIFTKIRKAEDDAESSRRALTRELVEVGTWMINKEEILRASHNIENIAGFLTGITFRLSHIEQGILLKYKIIKDMGELIDMVAESLRRLNDMVETLPIDRASTIETANQIQELGRKIDYKYRSFMKSIMGTESAREIIILKDIVERIKALNDLSLASAESITIVALGL